MPRCRICYSPVMPFISFGKMPIANGFLSPEQFGDEYFFELKAGFCPTCHVVQLIEQPDRERMFHDQYAFYSSTSSRMALHFQEFADSIRRDYLKAADPFVIEIGSNDGILLQNFASRNIRHLGIEPSENVARVATGKGVHTLCQFFDEELALEIVDRHGPADAFLGANVMCHISYIHSIIAGIRRVLKPDGIVQFEDPYLGDVIENTTYDQIYDEHVFLFSVSSVKYLFNLYDMEVIDVKPQTTHGGSMRYIAAHQGAYAVSDPGGWQTQKEKKMGLDRPETYETFRRHCEKSRNSLRGLLDGIRKRRKRIVGYAATSKSTTVINYCGLDRDHLEFISDTTPLKQGKYSPGAHIPVRSHDEFAANYPDYALLFAYNHAEEILAKEQAFRQSGGRWILYMPKVHLIE